MQPPARPHVRRIVPYGSWRPGRQSPASTVPRARAIELRAGRPRRTRSRPRGGCRWAAQRGPPRAAPRRAARAPRPWTAAATGSRRRAGKPGAASAAASPPSAATSVGSTSMVRTIAASAVPRRAAPEMSAEPRWPPSQSVRLPRRCGASFGRPARRRTRAWARNCPFTASAAVALPMPLSWHARHCGARR